MFAPEQSRPPYFPSYHPPDAAELESLFTNNVWMAAHGHGAIHETWKIHHGVYLSESRESEMQRGEMQRTTQALQNIHKLMRGGGKAAQTDTARLMREAAAAAAAAVVATDPPALIYSDPHAYAQYIERQNSSIFTLFSFTTDKWAMLKNTPFMRYLYHGMMCVDVGRLDVDTFETSMQFLERTPNMHTLALHDSYHISTNAASSRATLHMKAKARSHPTRERVSGFGGGSAGARQMGGTVKLYPNEKKVIVNIATHLPTFLQRNAATLVHLELYGILLPNWDEIIRLLSRCTSLQRLYLKQCNIGDAHFADLVDVMKTHLRSLNAVQMTGIGITSLSASYICSLLKSQTELRETLHWQQYLRQETMPAPSPSMLLPNSLASQGLVSIDLSDNDLGDKGVSMICDALARDTWLKGIDLTENHFGEVGLAAIVQMLEENRSLLHLQLHGSRDANVHPQSELPLARRTTTDLNGHQIRLPPPTSSAKLLQQFDPHCAKRAKRLLLLFHQQQVETTRFTTGQPPVPPGGDVAVNRFPSPGAAQVFDRFFKPQSELPPYAVNVQTAPKRRPLTSSSKASREPLMSPLIRDFAARRDQEAAIAAEIAKNRSAARGSRADQSTSTTTTRVQPALNFLFPYLHLVSPMERMLQADVSLRSKPAFTDNVRPGKDAAADAAAAAIALHAKPKAGKVDPTDLLSQSHLDFRPCLRETAVGSTTDYIEAEKAAYKKRIRKEQEEKGIARIRELASGVGGSRTSDTDPLTAADAASQTHLAPSPPPPHSFAPLTGLVQRVEDQLSHLGAQVATDQLAAVRSLQEEHERLAREVDRLGQQQQPQQQGQRRRATNNVNLAEQEAPATREEVAPVSQAAQPLAAPAPSPDEFDLSALTSALSAATAASAASGQAPDPELITYLEQQFQRLHAYMDLIESMPVEELEASNAAAVETTTAATPQLEVDPSTNPHHEPSDAPRHHSVMRVEESESVPAETPSLASAADLSFHAALPSASPAAEAMGGGPAVDTSHHASHDNSISISHVEVEEELEVAGASMSEEDLSAAVSDRMHQLYGLEQETE